MLNADSKFVSTLEFLNDHLTQITALSIVIRITQGRSLAKYVFRFRGPWIKSLIDFSFSIFSILMEPKMSNNNLTSRVFL